MKLKINFENKILKPFTIDKLPNFVVITGENGSGKTQLLKALSVENIMNEYFEKDKYVVQNISELYSESEKLTKINYIPAHGHNFDLGEYITANNYLNNWGDLPKKYYSYLNLKTLKDNKSFSHAEFNNYYKNEIAKEFKTSVNDHSFKKLNVNITTSDFNLFEVIYENKINKNEPTSIQECIINIPITNNNLFSTNLTLLYLQYKCKEDLGYKNIDKPWETFNQILETANFKYRINPPIFNDTINFKAELIDIIKDKIVNIENLSSGEKTIMSLMLTLYNSKNNTTFPEVILFDEPDSSLHPSMSKQMLDVLQNVFVKTKKCKVIITTHSPTTVALSPDLSLYRMDRDLGILKKESKENAIKTLTKGLENISIYFENRKQVFTESLIDKKFYEITYNNLKRKGILNDNISLEFITTSERKENGDNSGGCTFVKKFVKILRDSGNNTIYGIIDYDNKNVGNEFISVLGKNIRYSIENYILDPVFLLMFIVLKEEKEKLKIGFKEEEYITDFMTINSDKIQFHIDEFLRIYKLFENDEKIDYINTKGEKYSIPSSWINIKGHSKKDENLVDILYEKLPFLGKYKSIDLTESILEVVKMFTEFLPLEIIETYKEIESK
ncbi:MAG: AAA family ATPase [Polaribacter sp.]|uniref:AAA family ATPase n=1 Tax=Polaribacter sp. TaxID=1920175 RepID=UPI003EF0AA7B